MQSGNINSENSSIYETAIPLPAAMPAPIFRYRYYFAGIYLMLLLGFGWESIFHNKVNSPNSLPPAVETNLQISRDSLLSLHRENRRMMFVYGTADAEMAEITRKRLMEYLAKWHEIELAVKSDTEVTEADMANWSLFVIGHPEQNTLLKEMMPNLPFEMTGDSLMFNGKIFAQNPMIAVTLYPNPLQPNRPINLVCSNAQDQILDHIDQQNPYWYSVGTYGYQVINDKSRVIMGFFDQSPANQWRIGGELHWDYSEAPRPTGDFAGLKMLQHDPEIPATQIDSIGRALETQFAKARKLLQAHGKADDKPLEVHLFASTESKGMMTGQTDPAHVKNDAIYLALAPEYSSHPNGEPMKALLRRSLPVPAMPLLEDGLAIWLTDAWQAKGWAYWAAHLHHRGNAMPLSELLDQGLYKIESPLVTGCLAAALVDLLMQKWGEATFFRRYHNWKPSGSDIRQLATDFPAHLTQLVTAHQANFPARRGVKGLPSYHKGFNFAHEGYQIYNGYISSAATKSMAYTAEELHCNTTAIVPYTGMSDPEKPSYLHIANGAGGENDESVVHCIYAAHQSGMTAMLKPQVWLYRGWPGSVEMKSEADWQEFFMYYYRWMRHYALLAEMYGADVLCAGVEFQEATLSHPEMWRQLIRQLRGIYSGPITYAANWGREFEQLKFWDELDFIGLNCYYPLSNKADATDAELDRGYADVMNKVGKVAGDWKKQIVFTEIGFPSLAASWQEPHAEARDRDSSPEDQARCYRAMIRALKGREWCDGVYLWKWGAFPERKRELHRGFTPRSKPTQALIETWFEGI